jgi:hypothetical protein
VKEEKIFEKNTRKARNTRNTYGQLLYLLVFFCLKKTKKRKRKTFQNTRKARNTRNPNPESISLSLRGAIATKQSLEFATIK